MEVAEDLRGESEAEATAVAHAGEFSDTLFLFVGHATEPATEHAQ